MFYLSISNNFLKSVLCTFWIKSYFHYFWIVANMTRLLAQLLVAVLLLSECNKCCLGSIWGRWTLGCRLVLHLLWHWQQSRQCQLTCWSIAWKRSGNNSDLFLLPSSTWATWTSGCESKRLKCNLIFFFYSLFSIFCNKNNRVEATGCGE